MFQKEDLGVPLGGLKGGWKKCLQFFAKHMELTSQTIEVKKLHTKSYTLI